MVGVFLRSVCLLALFVLPASASVHSIDVSGAASPATISPNGDNLDDSAMLSLTYSGAWQGQTQGDFAYSWASLAGQPQIYPVALNAFMNGGGYWQAKGTAVLEPLGLPDAVYTVQVSTVLGRELQQKGQDLTDLRDRLLQVLPDLSGVQALVEGQMDMETGPRGGLRVQLVPKSLEIGLSAAHSALLAEVQAALAAMPSGSRLHIKLLATQTSSVASLTVETYSPPVLPGEPLAIGVDEDSVYSGLAFGAVSLPQGHSFLIVGQPSHGYALLTDDLTGAITYYPDPDYYGADSLEIVVTDGLDYSDIAVISITVNPVNDAPQITPITLTVQEDSTTQFLVSAYDPDGDALTFDLGLQGSLGLATVVNAHAGIYGYVLSPDIFGTDSLEVTVSDGLLTDSEIVAVIVESVNDAPEVESPQLFDINANASNILSGQLVATDVDGDNLQYAVISDPSFGLFEIGTTGYFTYTLDSDTAASDQAVVTVSDGFTSITLTVQILISRQLVLPPDPASIAPPLNPTEPYAIYAASSFLWESINPVIYALDATTIAPERMIVFHGRISDVSGAPLPGVLVSIAGHPEFGFTYSRDDGRYEAVANGGNVVVLDFQKEAFARSQRSVRTPWAVDMVVEDLIMTPLSTQATTISLGSLAMPVRLDGDVVTVDGLLERQLSVLIEPGTEAYAELPGGSEIQLSDITVRLTDVSYLDGRQMPAELPKLTAFTYAANLQIDEADILGATSVRFSKPVFAYVDNFHEFSTGDVVPTGYYDFECSCWQPMIDGVVVKVVGLDGASAIVSLSSTNTPASTNALAYYGITEEELLSIAERFEIGKSFWRIPLHHFSFIDANWPPQNPRDTEPLFSYTRTRRKRNNTPPPPPPPPPPNPNDPPLPLIDPLPDIDDADEDVDDDDTDDDDVDKDEEECGSIIGCQSRSLGQDLPLVGTEEILTYRSKRVAGRKDSRKFRLKVVDAWLDWPLRIEGRVQVAGRILSSTIYPTYTQASGQTWFVPNTTIELEWDGRDAYGRVVYGIVPAYLGAIYYYRDGFISGGEDLRKDVLCPRCATDEFSYQKSFLAGATRGTPLYTRGSRFERPKNSVSAYYKIRIRGEDVSPISARGWTLDSLHRIDNERGMLIYGDGSRERINTAPDITGANAQSKKPILRLSDGSILAYAIDSMNERFEFYKVFSDGYVQNLAGLSGIGSIGASTEGPNGQVYLTVNFDCTATYGVCPRIFRLTFPTIFASRIEPIAGKGDTFEYNYPAIDGVVGLGSQVNPESMAASDDGTLYFYDSATRVIRALRSDGRIYTYAGKYYDSMSYPMPHNALISGQKASDAELINMLRVRLTDENSSIRLAMWKGDLVFSNSAAVYRVTVDGFIHRIIGRDYTNCSDSWCSEAIPSYEPFMLTEQNFMATDASAAVVFPTHIYSANGSLYFYDHIFGNILNLNNAGDIDVVVGRACNFMVQSCPIDSSTWSGIRNTNLTYRASNFAVAPNGELWVVNGNYDAVRFSVDGQLLELGRPIGLGPVVPSDRRVYSKDGSELYIFDQTNRHIQTRNAWTDALIRQFGYNSQGYLNEVLDSYGKATQFEYVPNFGVIQALSMVIGPFGLVNNIQTNTDREITGLLYPNQNQVAYTYSAEGSMISFTDARENLHSFLYDADGYLKRDFGPDGFEWTLGRYHLGNGYAVALTSAEGRTTVHEVRAYSDMQTFATIWPDGTQRTLTKNGEYQSNLVMPEGQQIITEMQADPRTTEIALPVNVSESTPGGRTRTQTVTRSIAGGILSPAEIADEVRINNRLYTRHIQRAVRTETQVSPEGRETVIERNIQGDAVNVQVPGIAPVAMEHNNLGQLISVSTGSGLFERVTQYFYNDFGWLDSVQDAEGRTTSYDYDLAGRVIVEYLPGGRTVQYSYDPNGNVSSITPPGRPTHEFAYTALDLMQDYLPPDLTSTPIVDTNYAYDRDRNLELVTQPDGRQIDVVNDAAGRVDAVITSAGTYDYEYHPSTGQLASILAPGGELLEYAYDGKLLTTTAMFGTVNALVTRGYDNDFVITSRTVNGQSISFAYDNDKLLTQAGDLNITRNAATGFIGSTTLGNVTTSLAYNAFGELAQDGASYGATALYGATFDRDKLGRITSKTETVQGVTTVYDYEYDAAGRLDRVFVNGALSSDYAYDLNGNRLEKVGTAGTESGVYDDQDRLLSFGDYSYTYDANGNLTTRTNTTNSATEQYSYDELGNLRSVVLANGDLIEYVIDGQNRRIAKTLNGAVQYRLVYKDQLEPVAMVDAAGAVLQRYVYGTRSHVPDYVLASGVRYRIVSDHLGSVRMVVNSSTGAVVQRIDYDEFGRVMADTAPGWQPFGYAGGIVDGDTGLVRFGARDYDAQNGRWTSKDPVRFDGGENLYVYADGDPINGYDTNGLQTVWVGGIKVDVPDSGGQIVDCTGTGSDCKVIDIPPTRPTNPANDLADEIAKKIKDKAEELKTPEQKEREKEIDRKRSNPGSGKFGSCAPNSTSG